MTFPMASLIKILLGFVFVFSTQTALAGMRGSFGLGHGTGHRQLDQEYSFKSLGGHLEVHYEWNRLLFGAGFVSIYAIDGNGGKNYVDMGAMYTGFNIAGMLDLMAGWGLGKWKKETIDINASPRTSNTFFSDGDGPYLGARLYLYKGSHWSIGFSGTYYKLKSLRYKQDDAAGVVTRTETLSEANGFVIGIVFSGTTTAQKK